MKLQEAGNTNVRFLESPELLTCALHGKMDSPACLALEGNLLARIGKFPGGVCLDLSQVTYVTSAFLRICIQAAQLKKDKPFRIVRPIPEVRAIFAMAGLDKLLNVG